jgi:acyl-lipid omega-6 desaturase (Delta-12 desaturase)
MMTPARYAELAQKARPLRPQNRRAAQELTLQLLWITAGLGLSATSAGWLLGQVLLGFGFWRSFVIMHAAGHGAFFSNTYANAAAGLINSLFCFIPYTPWRDIHEAHHRWTGWRDLDPTTMELENELPEWKKKVIDFCWRYWIPLLSVHYIASLFYALKRKSFLRSKVQAAGSILLILMPHLLMALTNPQMYMKLFGVAALIYLNLGDLSLLTQHVHLPLDHSGGRSVRPKLFREQDEFSHTVLFPEWVDRWLSLGFNHHALHHLFPRLPYYLAAAVTFQGCHTHHWRDWFSRAKGMKASQLLYPALSDSEIDLSPVQPTGQETVASYQQETIE